MLRQNKLTTKNNDGRVSQPSAAFASFATIPPMQSIFNFKVLVRKIEGAFVGKIKLSGGFIRLTKKEEKMTIETKQEHGTQEETP